MRHGRMVVLSAVLLTGLAGCADGPNDLEAPHDRPANSVATTTAPAAAPAANAVPDQAAAASSSARQEIADEVEEAVLTRSDLSGQGVRAATKPVANGVCFKSVPLGDPRGASWTYSSGSTFTQQVTGYLDENAADVLDRVDCDGQKMSLSTPSGAEAISGWCASGTCAVLIAAGHVLSGLQVDASTTSRAQDAVRSLVPLAAEKLPSS